MAILSYKDKKKMKKKMKKTSIIYYSLYESPYDSVHDLLTKVSGLWLSFEHQLHLLVNTYQEQLIENSIANHLVQEIVQGIVW
jgi:hypothetical protein